MRSFEGDALALDCLLGNLEFIIVLDE